MRTRTCRFLAFGVSTPKQLSAVRFVLLALVLACGDSVAPPVPVEEPPAPQPIDASVDVAEQPLHSLFLGESDVAWRESLRNDDVVRIERGGSGRSLGFRITLASGRRAYFKPEQSFSGAHWYSEIAAHYLDRELGFGRAPPVVGRELYWPPLRNVARRAEDGRIGEVEVGDDNMVRGALIGWIEGGVPPLRLGRFWERWVRVEGAMPFSPYQRTADYRGLINNRIDPHETEMGRFRESEPEGPNRRVRELSDLIVFDYLISNVDRWGGEFTNVRLAGRGGPLIFLDNGAGFWVNNRINLMETRLHALQRFNRTTVDAIEAFDLERFRRRLESDPLHPVLNERRIRGVEERRLHVLEHVRDMEQRFGERVFIE